MRGTRLALATVLASMLWGGFVMSSRWLWEPAAQQPARERTIEMRLVELPPPTSAPAPAPAPQRPAITPPRPRVHEVRPRAPIRAVVPPLPAIKPPPTPPEPPSAAAQQPTPNTAKPADTSTTSAATPSPSSGTGNAPARLLSQPLPDLPDDLREAAYRATAIARFTVHANGSADVELIHPTPIPRLNQILLDALHRWRFAPAMQNGRPVESHQDVRVHFNVS